MTGLPSQNNNERTAFNGINRVISAITGTSTSGGGMQPLDNPTFTAAENPAFNPQVPTNESDV